MEARKVILHRGFAQILGSYHPTICKFIEGLKEIRLNELKLEQYVAGEQPPNGRKISKDKQGYVRIS